MAKPKPPAVNARPMAPKQANEARNHGYQRSSAGVPVGTQNGAQRYDQKKVPR